MASTRLSLRGKPIRIDGLYKTELSEEQSKNSALNLKEFQKRKMILKSYPRRVILELTNMCNYRCIMCGRTYSSFRPTYLDTGIIDKLKIVFQKTEEVTLFGWGEPTIHPEFIDVFRKLAEFKNLRKFLLTNGSNLDFIKKVVKKGYVDILSISLDGSTPEMNNEIRQGSDFNYIVKKIKEIVSLEKEGVPLPHMNLVFVVMKRNVHQLPGMVELTKELGLPEFKAVYITSFHEELDGETIWNNQEDYKEYFNKAIELAKKYGILLKFPPFIGEDPAGNSLHRECSVVWRDLFIGSDDFVRPCQSTSLKIANINDYNLENPKDFFQLWNHPKFQEMRRTIDDNDNMNANCKVCYQASHANWNMKHAHLQKADCSMPDWG